MTKAEMIRTIQAAEAEAWLLVKQAEAEFGIDDRFTARQRAAWSTVYELMQTMGIPQDLDHPASLAGFEIVVARVRREREAAAAE
jgi:hypothetical protein